MDRQIIELRKKYSALVKQSWEQAKQDRCILCGKQTTRFCDSHTIPQMVLRNIETNGKFDFFNTFMDNPLDKKDQGIKEATVFRLICNECDNQVFQDYEDEECLLMPPTENMLREIALKNTLLYLSKRFFDKEFYPLLKKKYRIEFPDKAIFDKLDIRDYLWDINRIRTMIDGDEGRFKLITWDKVDYRIPIAFQGPLSVYADMEGKTINNIYDKTGTHIIKRMHLCAFPLTSCSIIFTFYHEDDSEYDAFADQIQSMDQEDRLSFLGYLLFYTSEDIMIAHTIPHRTYFLNKAQSMFEDAPEAFTGSVEEYEALKKRHLNKLKEWNTNTFPGVLTKKYALP